MCYNNHPVYPQPYVRTRTHLALAISCRRDPTSGKEARWDRILDLEPVKVQGYRHHYPTILALHSNHSSASLYASTHRIAVVYTSFFMKRFKKTLPEGIRSLVVDVHLEGVVKGGKS